MIKVLLCNYFILLSNIMKILIIQPRHNYASDPQKELKGHIYLPTSLLTAAARLIRAGIEVILHDENLRPAQITSNKIGVNLVGAPYIPEVIKLKEKLQLQIRDQIELILGGAVISGLTRDQITKLFGKNAINGNNDVELTQALGIKQEDMLPPEKTSLIPAYEQISDEDMYEYLNREFTFYLSQGCKFACDFCPAVRTRRDLTTGKMIKCRESYRNINIAEKDLEYLIIRAKKLGLNKLSMYLSNLDVFQTPDKLMLFARKVNAIKERHPDFKIILRGLSTVDSYLKARGNNRECVEELIKAGFNTVGFGVDGMTPEVWKKIKKGHNTEDKCIEAIRSAREEFGITPEILMVFGHLNADTPETLKLAVEFTKEMVKKYGAVPRPHVAKSFVPGSDGWNKPENQEAVEALINNPEAFQSLDFTALPSPLTHKDPRLIELVTRYFLEICQIPGNTTQATQPILPEMSEEEIAKVKKQNEGKYDR